MKTERNVKMFLACGNMNHNSTYDNRDGDDEAEQQRPPRSCQGTFDHRTQCVSQQKPGTVKRFFFLSQTVRGPCYTVGPGNEKQTRTLTDAEDCCEDVCIVLICGWSVDVSCQHTPSDSAVWHTSVKRQHTHKNLKLRTLHKRIK